MTKFSDLESAYTYNVPASALLFSNVHGWVWALRVEVPDLGKEFSDGNYIGTDPEGTLYYNDIHSLEPQAKKVKYKVEKLTGDKGPLLHIKFFHETEESCHAEFLAEDPAGIVSAAGMDGYQDEGNWFPLDICVATASVRKYDDESKITITIASINKTATITVPKGVLDHTPIEVKGNLSFKRLNGNSQFDTGSLGNGKFASWNNDRVVFYFDDLNSKDFTAYFIPLEFSEKTLGITTDKTYIFEDVTWA
ncbi:hypothetical protein DFH07DRAFT_942731 [Mycena maculata]|uniref:Uncharacterized protein n=1 Tax=Mycena maculata TaxID=230809 RepID=A0AAD7IPB4_9AGAR|nr:hypothetical protein DFH07DRAFT_942731 [Mycena maculata]